jgi:hypothetical protein
LDHCDLDAQKVRTAVHDGRYLWSGDQKAGPISTEQ